MSWTDKQSDAVKKVAETVASLKPEIRKAGEFIGKAVGQPIGLLNDLFGVARLEVLFAYEKRFKRKMAERGLSESTRAIPLSMLYPLLEAASLEEDENLSEMLADLLANTLDASFEGYIPKSFVETLRNMSPFEALLLKRMSEAPTESRTKAGYFYTAGLPTKFFSMPRTEHKRDEMGTPSRDVRIALASLKSAGCVDLLPLISGGNSPTEALVTEYGSELLRACSSAEQNAKKNPA